MRKHIFGGLALILGTVVMPMTAHAVTVNCTAGKKIADALTQGATDIKVVGTCNENVVIRRDDVTIEGVNSSATVVGSLLIDGTNRITIKKLIVQGAATPAEAGILIDRGGTAVLDNVTVRGMIEGVVANGSSFVEIRNNSLFENNAGSGVTIALGSSAVVRDSLSQLNGDSGIGAVRGGSVELVHNTVVNNVFSQVFAVDNSYATLTANTITATGDGIGLWFVRDSSARLRGGNTITAAGGQAIFLQLSSELSQRQDLDTIEGNISLIRLNAVEFVNANISGFVSIDDHSIMTLASANATVNGDVSLDHNSSLSFEGSPSVTGTVSCNEDALSRFYGQEEWVSGGGMTDCIED